MLLDDINFIAIDFETATPQHASICEAGICVVRAGKIVETRSWLVRPQDNRYSYWNMQIHGIHPEDTADAPDFPQVWAEISEYLQSCPILVAHNAAFDISCIRHSLALYGLPTPDVTYYCTLRTAKQLYDFPCNTLNYLCDQFHIPTGTHHRAAADALMCAHLFLQELKDLPSLSSLPPCTGKL